MHQHYFHFYKRKIQHIRCKLFQEMERNVTYGKNSGKQFIQRTIHSFE